MSIFRNILKVCFYVTSECKRCQGENENLTSSKCFGHNLVKDYSNKGAFVMAKRIRTHYAKGNKTKELVLETALELISSKGYQNVTIDEICANCNVTKGAFYHHFKSKESMLDQIHLKTDAYIENKIPRLLEKEPSLDRFMELSYLYAEMTENRGVEIMKQKIRNNLDSDNRNVQSSGFYDPERRPLLNLFKDIYTELQEMGKVTKTYSFKYFFHFLIVTYDGVVLDWCYNNGDYDLPEAVKQATRRYLLGFDTAVVGNGSEKNT